MFENKSLSMLAIITAGIGALWFVPNAVDACAASIDVFVCHPKQVFWGHGSIDKATLASSNTDVQILDVVNDGDTGVASFWIHCLKEGKKVAEITGLFTEIDPGSKHTKSKPKDIKLWVNCSHL